MLYLVPGNLGEDAHHHLQNRVTEYLLQLLVISPSVGHLVILPLLKPLIVSKAHQTQGGLACGEWETKKGSKHVCSAFILMASDIVSCVHFQESILQNVLAWCRSETSRLGLGTHCNTNALTLNSQ